MSAIGSLPLAEDSGNQQLNPDVAYFAPALLSSNTRNTTLSSGVPLNSLALATLPPPNVPVSHAMSVLAATHNPSHDPVRSPTVSSTAHDREVGNVVVRGLPVFGGNTTPSISSTSPSHTDASQGAASSSAWTRASSALSSIPLLGTVLSLTGLLPGKPDGSKIPAFGKSHSGEVLSDLEFLQRTGAINGLTTAARPHSLWDKLSLAYFRIFRETRDFFRDMQKSPIPVIIAILVLAYQVQKLMRTRRNIHDRNIVITGADTALGALVAVEIAKRGARVVLWGRSAAKLALTRAAVLHHVPSAQVFVYAVDVADSYAITLLAQRCIEEVGFLYGLVHLPCAHPAWKPVVKLRTRDVAMTTADVHLLTWTLRALVPEMIEKREGCIVSLVADADGTVARPLGSDYRVFGGNTLNHEASIVRVLQNNDNEAATPVPVGEALRLIDGYIAGGQSDGGGSVTLNVPANGKQGAASVEQPEAKENSPKLSDLTLNTRMGIRVSPVTDKASIASAADRSEVKKPHAAVLNAEVVVNKGTPLLSSKCSTTTPFTVASAALRADTAAKMQQESQGTLYLPSQRKSTGETAASRGSEAKARSLYPQPDVSLEVKPRACLDPMLIPFSSAQKALSGIITAGKMYVRDINRSPEDPLNGYSGVSDGKIHFSQVRVGFRTDTHTAARGILRSLDFGDDVDVSSFWCWFKRSCMQFVEIAGGIDARITCAEVLCTIERTAQSVKETASKTLEGILKLATTLSNLLKLPIFLGKCRKMLQKLQDSLHFATKVVLDRCLQLVGKRYIAPRRIDPDDWPQSARAGHTSAGAGHASERGDRDGARDDDDEAVSCSKSDEHQPVGPEQENGQGRKRPFRNFAYVGKEAASRVVTWRDDRDPDHKSASDAGFSISRPGRKITWHDDFFPGYDSHGFPVCPKYTYDLTVMPKLPEVKPPAYPYYLAQHDIAMYRLCGLTSLKDNSNGNAPISPLSRGSLLQAKEELHMHAEGATALAQPGSERGSEAGTGDAGAAQRQLSEFYSHSTSLFGAGTPDVVDLAALVTPSEDCGVLSRDSSRSGIASGMNNRNKAKPEGLPTGLKSSLRKPDGLASVETALFGDIPIIRRRASSDAAPELKPLENAPSLYSVLPSSPVKSAMYSRFIQVQRCDVREGSSSQSCDVGEENDEKV